MSDTCVMPATACYWVRLAASPRRWTRDRILAEAEAYIPSAIDTLDLVWSAGTDGQVVVLACEPDRLDRVLAAHPQAWTVTPDAIPELVQVAGVSPDHLNLLVGRRAPPPVRRADLALRWGAVAASAIIALLLIIAAVQHRRVITAAAERTEADQAARMAALLPPALGGSDPDPMLRLDQAERLTASLLRAADGADGSASRVLAAMLGGWPAQLRLQIASVAIDSNRCTISGQAASVEDAQTVAQGLAAALSNQTGWRVLPLQATAAATGVSFTCTVVREGA